MMRLFSEGREEFPGFRRRWADCVVMPPVAITVETVLLGGLGGPFQSPRFFRIARKSVNEDNALVAMLVSQL
jgi:hypothetical protein